MFILRQRWWNQLMMPKGEFVHVLGMRLDDEIVD